QSRRRRCHRPCRRRRTKRAQGDERSRSDLRGGGPAGATGRPRALLRGGRETPAAPASSSPGPRSLAASDVCLLGRLRAAPRRRPLAAHDTEPPGPRGAPRRSRGRGMLANPMSKRIHELAKEWSQNPKDLLRLAEPLGIRGKRPQSTLTDDEVTRLRDGLGLTPRPAVTVGSERVVAERVVTQRDSSADQLVTAIEQTTEARLRPNVIRRRTAREVLKREELPPTVPDAEPAVADIPPSLDFEPDFPPAVDDIPPPSRDVLADDVLSPPRPARPRRRAPPAPEPATDVSEPERVETAATPPPPAPAAERPVARVARPAPVAPPTRPAAPAAAPAIPGAAPPPGFEEMRGVKVLGKIDLRKATPPPG